MLAAAVMVIGVFGLAPIPHGYAARVMVDRRNLSGLPNGFHGFSNIPFAAVGLLGLMAAFGRTSTRGQGEPD